MPGETKTTTDHEEIRRWVEERDGHPATVASTHTSDDPGVIRLDFPGYSGEDTLEQISWEEWFGKFEDQGLAFVYQETTADGGPSSFNRLVKRE